jgi:hypothetical protein
MLYDAQESHSRGDAVDCSEEGIDRFHRDDPAFSDDPLLTIACAISEQAIALPGPLFWMLIAYLFLADEFGH